MDDIKISAAVSADKFWNALEIYYKRPNSINKQVLLREDVLVVNLQSSINHSECHILYKNFHAKLARGYCLLADYASVNPNFEVIKPEFISEVYKNRTGMFLLIRRLIPKLYKDDSNKFYEFIFLDKSYLKAYIFTAHIVPVNFINGTESERQDPMVILKFDFIQLHWDSDFIKLVYNKNLNIKGVHWLKVTFINKFIKLLLNDSSVKKSSGNFYELEFKNQVDVVEYYSLYEELKKKYARTLIESWTETTDPKKFVYEDIGIAAYLILLWNGEKISKKGTKKQKFVDLGCGNGLLVHILNSEGHRGIGLDIRRRKIWDIYPSSTILKEETIIPTTVTGTTFPEADWLIGNHSDELTAWLPIMARKSSHSCQYFVLPCCPYELNGKKFQRKNSGLSSYQDFLYYVRDISNLCEFETCVDKLRIPSTKRICLLGFNRIGMTEKQYARISEKIINLIAQECQGYSNSEIAEKNESVSDFAPREPREPVRNCTRIPSSIRENILKSVMNELLKENVLCAVTTDGKTRYWNRGRRISIGTLAASVDDSLLKELKNECKGLQTLLKNYHFLFETSQGCVQFRAPESMLKICKKVLDTEDNSKWKRKNCWLFSNHPDGCALSDDLCSYAHVK